MGRKRKGRYDKCWISVAEKIEEEQRRRAIFKRKLAPIPLCDIWALDETLGRVIVKYLHSFKAAVKNSGATPTPFCVRTDEQGDRTIIEGGFEEWMKTVDKMIFAFQWYARGLRYAIERDATEEEVAQVKEGLRLFAEYFPCLGY